MKLIFSGIIMVSLSQLALAIPPDSAGDPAELLRSQQSTATAQLLQLQRSGKVASRHEQQLPGSALSKTYERYINSFGHAIPETYISEDFTE